MSAVDSYNNQPLIFNTTDDAIVSDAVMPKAFKISDQHFALLSWIVSTINFSNQNEKPAGSGLFRRFMKKKSFRIPIARMIIVYKNFLNRSLNFSFRKLKIVLN